MKRSVRTTLSTIITAGVLGSSLSTMPGAVAQTTPQAPDEWNLRTYLDHQPDYPTQEVCGLRADKDIEQFTGEVPPTRKVNGWTYSTTPLVQIGAPANNVAYRYWPGNQEVGARYYIIHATKTGWAARIYDAETGTKIKDLAREVPEDMRHGENQNVFFPSGTAVDPESGDIFFATYYTRAGRGLASRWSVEDGSMVWRSAAGQLATGGLYTYEADGETRLGLVTANKANTFDHSTVFDPETGEVIGNNPVVGGTINQSNGHENELVTASHDGIRVFNAEATEQIARLRATPEVFSLPGLSEATISPEGQLLIFLGRGTTMVYALDGTFLGRLNADPGNGPAIENQGDNRGIYYDPAREALTWASDNNGGSITSMKQEHINAWLDHKQGAPWELGAGAGLLTGVKANYFEPGQQPQVFLRTSTDWMPQAKGMVAEYTVSTVEGKQVNRTPRTYTRAVPWAFWRYLMGYADSPLYLPPATPGVYQVDVTLKNAQGEEVGTDCVQYTVGAEDTKLSFDNLPASRDARGVEMSYRLGQSGFRSVYDLNSCYPGVTNPTTDTPVACPSSMVADVKAAAALADEYGIKYEIQLGRGGVSPMVAAGPEVTEHLVTQMSQALPEVRHWEVWNEPDTNTFRGGQDYVDRAVIPISAGLRAADPEDTVTGGSYSTNDYRGGWWQPFFNSGLEHVDNVAIHPYTGHNRSFEEHGFIIPPDRTGEPSTGALLVIKDELERRGFEGNLVDTEQGFWAGGTYNMVTQGNRLMRKLILERSIGIETTINFQNEADYPIEGLRFSLINEGALTSGGAASAVYQKMLADRPFVQWLTTTSPHIHAAEFGPEEPGGDSVVALWSDDVIDSTVVRLSNGEKPVIHDQYGAPVTVHDSQRVRVTGAVQYVTVPAGETATISNWNLYRTNVLEGATAQASSEMSCSGRTLSASHAVDGIEDAQARGDLCSGKPAWAAAVGDSDPSLTITLDEPSTVRRVHVVGQDAGSVETSLRGYRVSFDTGEGTFGHEVVVKDQFFQRSQMITLPAAVQGVERIRIDQFSINYSGNGNGNPPAFWTTGFPGEPVIYEVLAY